MDSIRNARARMSAFFNSRLFDPSWKTFMHCAQLFLVVLAIGLTGGRLSTKPKEMPVSRSDTLAIVMGVKTIVVLAYQMLTTHVHKLRKWRSLKAYIILNSLEIVFWFVVIIITLMGVSRYCKGTYCALSWIGVLIALMLMVFAFWTAIASRRLRMEETLVGQIPAMYSYDDNRGNKV